MLQQVGIQQLVAHFDAFADEGTIDGVDSEPEVPNELSDQLDELIHLYLDIEEPGGECGRGQFGHVEWDLEVDEMSHYATPHEDEDEDEEEGL